MANANEASGLAENQFLMLPEMFIIEAIRYVPISERKNVGLVCTKFYELFIVETDATPLSLDYSQVSETNARTELMFFNVWPKNNLNCFLEELRMDYEKKLISNF